MTTVAAAYGNDIFIYDLVPQADITAHEAILITMQLHSPDVRWLRQQDATMLRHFVKREKTRSSFFAKLSCP